MIAYSLGGPLDEGDLDDTAVARKAFETFRASQGGLVDAQAAVAYALAARREVDADRLCVAGHSSAASVALLVAAMDGRIKACAAYAPVTDIVARMGEDAASVESVLPGVTAFERDVSPMFLPPPRGKVLIFHADDDTPERIDDARRYVAKLGAAASYQTVPTGGHYDAMIADGIPGGVRFLKAQLGSP